MIIKSLLDNDLYKFTMQQVVLHKYSHVSVEYLFVNRGSTPLYHYADAIKEEILQLSRLSLTDEEAQYMRSLQFFQPNYIEFLTNMRLNPGRYVHVTADKEHGLQIRIKGPWLHTILFEVPVLAIISEIAGAELQEEKGISKTQLYQSARHNIEYKTRLVRQNPGMHFADFGTRRRFSFAIHDLVIQELKAHCSESFVGTSNVYLARHYGVKSIGTMAHEYLMAHQQIYNLHDHQKIALNHWAEEYHGKLGIVLTDTLTTRMFLQDFHLGHAKLFDGVRQDSGDPYEVAEKFIAHYERLGIDPKTKTIIFSDSLNFDKAAALYHHFKDRIKISFGIGTNLTNDIDCLQAPNIVIKMISVYGLPIAKISDSPGKEICEDPYYLNYLKNVLSL